MHVVDPRDLNIDMPVWEEFSHLIKMNLCCFLQDSVHIINVAMFTLPSTSMRAHAMNVMLSRHPRPRERKTKKVEVKGSSGGPRVVVSTAAFHARVRGSVPGLGGLKETKNASSPSTCESQ